MSQKQKSQFNNLRKRCKFAKKQIRLLLTCALCLLVINVQAFAIGVSSVSRDGNFEPLARITPFVFPHTVSALNAERVLYVGVSSYVVTGIVPTTGAVVSDPLNNPTGVKYAGISMTRVTAGVLPAVFSPTSKAAVEVFRLDNPPVGTANVEVNAVLAAQSYLVVGALTITGVDQANTPFNNLTPASGTNSNPSVNVTTTGASLILDVLSAEFGGGLAETATAGQTKQYDGRGLFGGLNDVGAASTKLVGGAGVFPMSWTLQQPVEWALGGIAIRATPQTASPASIGGSVVNQLGDPLINTQVLIRNLSQGTEQFVFTNEKGRYQLADLSLTDLYEVRVFRYGFRFQPDSHVFALTESRNDTNFVGARSKNWWRRN